MTDTASSSSLEHLQAENAELRALVFAQMDAITKATNVFLTHIVKPPRKKPLVGDIVQYVAYNGRDLAAIVLSCTDDEHADLAVFTAMENVNGDKNFGLQFHQNVPHRPSLVAGGWHYRP